MPNDYYQTLGVNSSASADDIKRAYRKLALKHHPDRGGSAADFQKIQEAYSVLNDPQRRKEYDNPYSQPNFGANQGPFAFDDFLRNFSQFEHIFSQARNPTPSINLSTTITLEQAYTGRDLVANITLPTGNEKVINVKIPAGIQNGTNLKLKSDTKDEYQGDIYLTIHVQPHSLYHRNGDDLYQEIEITAFQAMLGDKVQIKTIKGTTIEVVVPPGMQHGGQLRISGYGMPNMRDPRFCGSFILIFKINIPQHLTEKQRNFIRQAMD
jgi:curved DNA-binding protein